MRDLLKKEILNFIKAHDFFDEIDDEIFNVLALKIYKYQKQTNSYLGKYWGSQEPTHYKEIKPIPSEVWKFIRSGKGESFFESSATSTGVPLKHFYLDDEIYQAQTLKYFFQIFPDTHVDSLLTHRSNWSLKKMSEFLSNAKGSKKVLIGTSKNHLDNVESKNQLRTDFVFDTGGFKNFISPYSQEEYYRILMNHFQIPASQIVGEYGMTELFSQAYDVSYELQSESRKKRCVPTLKVFNFKNSSQIYFIDLCNLDSCSFVLSGDEGRVLNERDFYLLGRAQVFQTRGCSLI